MRENFYVGLYFGAYFLFFVLMCFQRSFRDDLIEWFAVRDPLGIQFWRNNIWFAAVSLIYFLLPLFFKKS